MLRSYHDKEACYYVRVVAESTLTNTACEAKEETGQIKLAEVQSPELRCSGVAGQLVSVVQAASQGKK